MFKINGVIGAGGFGVVLYGKDVINSKNIALKIVFRDDIKGEMLKYEYSILKDLDHPNIIKIYSFYTF